MELWMRIVVLTVFYHLNISLAVNPYSTTEEVQFEVLNSGGFRAYITDRENVTKFKLTVELNSTKRIQKHVKTATSGFWVLYFDDPVRVGDNIKYDIQIESGRLRYMNTNQEWKVEASDLRDTYSSLEVCKPASSIMNGKQGCIGKFIMLDEFSGPSLNRNNWIVEHSIPTYEGMNQEFNSYEDTDETIFIKGGGLYIKPTPRQTDEEVRGVLDLTNGCTSTIRNQCYYQQQGAFFLPPVKSARITSKASFKYGKVEIKAKLPAGEWIVPIIQLQSKDNNHAVFSPKILIAYSRGNAHLSGIGGNDIGSNLLYAGPVLSAGLPEQNHQLTKRPAAGDKPYCSDFHIYTLEWLPDSFSFYIDSQLYGKRAITNQEMSALNKELVLSLGVAVGGIDDFPDDCVSGSNPIPWNYNNRNFVKNFFDARNVWLNTWGGDDCALRIEYVKVSAI